MICSTRPLRRSLAILLAMLAGPQLLFAAPPEKAPAATPQENRNSFLRLRRDDDQRPLALEAAIVKYIPAQSGREGLSVDLVGAVHVGDKAYYQALNEAFEKYDVVLYELVAPPGTRVTKDTAKRSKHPVSALQDGLKSLLNLELQLETVDYSKENLVHADMSPDQFAKSMEDRGESFWTMFFKVMTDSIEQQAKMEAEGKSLSSASLFAALFDKDRAGALKAIMAEQFETLGGSLKAFDGPEGSTLVTERNKVALEGLTQQIAAGKKKIAIFYGAAHLPDMEQRLIADFDLKRNEERWLTAWDLKRHGEMPATDTK